MTTARRRQQMAEHYAANGKHIRAHRRAKWAAMPADVREAQLARLRANVKRWESEAHARIAAKRMEAA